MLERSTLEIRRNLVENWCYFQRYIHVLSKKKEKSEIYLLKIVKSQLAIEKFYQAISKFPKNHQFFLHFRRYSQRFARRFLNFPT